MIDLDEMLRIFPQQRGAVIRVLPADLLLTAPSTLRR